MAEELAETASRQPVPSPVLWSITPPYYPIVYVRGYAMTSGEREQVFNDGYYGFSASSVERREAPPPQYVEADIFEGLLIRLMKDHDYVDSVNRGLAGSGLDPNRKVDPTRSLWVSRFYDVDFVKQRTRTIEQHADDLKNLICRTIPARLKQQGVDLDGYKVILIAHSMGGLVCRTLIQSALPGSKREENDVVHNNDPKELVHRLVTIGTPNRGIDLGAIPDIIEDAIVEALNPFDSGIFKEPRMRSYLKLTEKSRTGDKDFIYDIHSLGEADKAKNPNYFPVKRCLCVIGSDWQQYGGVRRLTGGYSDGLVRQENAYIVAGPAPQTEGAKYDDAHQAFWVNVHRAHSGYRGIVNSYETYENVQRFLFGDIMLRMALDEIDIKTTRDPESTYFYDLDFAIAIRGTNTFLHRRDQTPCENAIRMTVEPGHKVPVRQDLHIGFLNSALRPDGEEYSHFLLRMKLTEYRVEPGFLWDREYPGRVLFGEDLEVRVDLVKADVQHRWLSDAKSEARNDGWKRLAVDQTGEVRIPLRKANAFAATLVVTASEWPDAALTHD